MGIPECAVKRCAVQISCALEFIHQRGLVHRDIKPENVLLLDTQCRCVKLADFGLTQRRGTFIRFISGTLPYMAPELCAMVLEEGQKEVNVPPLCVEPTLDTWAFAVLLFCILTGFFPWERCNDTDDFYEEFADWRRSPKKNPVPSQWKRFTPVCMEMFKRMLALDPNERCSIGEVKGYVGKDWVRAKDTNGWVGVNGEVSTSTPSPCRSSYSDEQ